MGDPVILQRGTVVTIGADGRRTYFKTASEKVARERARDIESDLVAVELNVVQPPAMSASIVKKADEYSLFVHR